MARMRSFVWTAFSLLGSHDGQAQTPPDYDFRFATVGAPGNVAYHDDDPAHAFINGRGKVDAAYRMSTLETSTGQWMEFLNAFGGPNGMPNQFWNPQRGWWGAEPAGSSYRLIASNPNASMVPVYGVSWRMGAMYCNWLNNGKSSAPNSLLTGAYDVSTWGSTDGGFTFTDGATHLAGAKFWIPSLDEQLKATQYDPNRFGTGRGGWWLSKNMSDLPGTPGLPGQGTTSAGLPLNPELPGYEFDIPLGSYRNSLSPWGLLDTSGATAELTEEVYPGVTPFGTFRRDRVLVGSYAGDTGTWAYSDMIWAFSTDNPQLPGATSGLRIASAIPSPPSMFCIFVGFTALWRRRKGH